MAIWIISAVVVIFQLWAVSSYNEFITARERIKNAMGQIAAQVQSRWDALTNLMEATKQYQAHEADTLRDVTAQRTAVGAGSSVAEVEADDALYSKALGSIRAVAENYPDLKASTVYLQTMSSVDQYENKVRQSRMIFNDSVTRWNRMVQQFPGNLLAGIFGFTTQDYFENEPAKAEMPQW